MLDAIPQLPAKFGLQVDLSKTLKKTRKLAFIPGRVHHQTHMQRIKFQSQGPGSPEPRKPRGKFAMELRPKLVRTESNVDKCLLPPPQDSSTPGPGSLDLELGDYLEDVGIALVLLGGLVALLGVFGCLGICCKNKCLLIVVSRTTIEVLCCLCERELLFGSRSSLVRYKIRFSTPSSSPCW